MELDRKKKISMLKKLKGKGLSLRKIADKMNTDGIETLTGSGKWHSGTVEKLLKEGKGDVEQAAIPLREAEEKETVPKALFDKALKQAERLNAEISRLKDQKTIQHERFQELLKENNELRQEKLDMGMSTQEVIKAVKPLIDGLRVEIAELRTLVTGVDIESIDKKKTVSVNGWSLLQSTSDGFYRAFKTVCGKQRSIYIGKMEKLNKASLLIASSKIRETIRRKGADWGLSESEIAEMTGGEASPE